MNYTMIAPPLNQAQIVARLAGATIAPAQVNATTHIDAPSLRYDGTDILARANTWTATQDFRAASASGQSTVINLQDNGAGKSLSLRYVADAIDTTPADVWQFRSGGAFPSRDIVFSHYDSSPVLTLRTSDSSGPNISHRSLAIGATALAASERLRVAGGTAPGTPAATECLFGAGVGRFGAQVKVASTASDSIETAGGAKIGSGISVATPGATGARLISASGTGTTVFDNTGNAELQFLELRGVGNVLGNFGFLSTSDFRIRTPGFSSLFEASIFRVTLPNECRVLGAIPAASTAGQTNSGGGRVDTFESYRIAGTQVVGPRGAAVADATDAATVITQLNALLARLRTHGLIAT